jgi:hypothetical protein
MTKRWMGWNIVQGSSRFRVGKSCRVFSDCRIRGGCNGPGGGDHHPHYNVLHFPEADTSDPRFSESAKWINALRDELAELFELLEWEHLLRPGTLSGEGGYRYGAEKRSRIRFLINKIKLRLNPQERDSQTLLEYLSKLQSADESNFYELMERAVAKGQEILKAEWRRVKKGQW